MAFVAMALSLAGGPGWAACKISTVDMPVNLVGSRAVATLSLNGQDVRMIVDSGAFFSSLTHAAAKQLKLKVDPLPPGMTIEGLTGEIESGMTTVERVQLLKGEIPNVQFLVGGNDDINGTMGLLGRNFLAMADTEYDLAHGTIRLVFPDEGCSNSNMAYWAADQAVSEVALLRDPRDRSAAIQAVAKLNDEKMRVVFDTGARSLVSLKAARRAGATELQEAGRVIGAGKGEAQAWTTRFNSFALGDETISNVRVTVADFDHRNIDMLLGIDFFLSHRIYVAKKQRRMYFTYNGGTIFALNAIEHLKAQAAAPSPAGATAAPAPKSDLPELPDAAAYARRGAAFLSRVDYANALADFDRACAMAPDVADGFSRRAKLHVLMKKPALALQDFETALKLDPSHTAARLDRAMLRVRTADPAGALEDLAVLDRTLAPESSQRYVLASLYEQMEMPERALPQWSHWIDSHPHDIGLANALNTRCWLRMQLNIELDLALTDCNKAIDLQPKQGNYYDSRGWLQWRRGELRKALADYERALKLKPSSSAWPLYGRGLVRRKLGDAEAGRADIEAARKADAAVEAWVERHGVAGESKPPASP